MNEKLWLGHPEELAKLAAAVSHGKSPAKAVAYAVELCRESVRAVDRIALEEGGVPGLGFNPFSTDRALEQSTKWEFWRRTVPKPDRFPATLNDFFDKIVKAQTRGRDEKRLRDFLCQCSFANDANTPLKADNLIQRIKEADKDGGFFSETKWDMMGGSYLDWWKGEKSRKAGESARQRKKKSS